MSLLMELLVYIAIIMFLTFAFLQFISFCAKLNECDDKRLKKHLENSYGTCPSCEKDGIIMGMDKSDISLAKHIVYSCPHCKWEVKWARSALNTQWRRDFSND